MHTIDDLKDIATQSDDVGETMSSFAKYAGEHYLEFHRFSADVGGIERIQLFDYKKNQEIINLTTQYLNGDGNNPPIVQLNRLAGKLAEDFVRKRNLNRAAIEREYPQLATRLGLQVQDPALNQDNVARHPSSPGPPNDQPAQLKSRTDYLVIQTVSSPETTATSASTSRMSDSTTATSVITGTPKVVGSGMDGPETQLIAGPHEV
jgi:hypothetical protein